MQQTCDKPALCLDCSTLSAVCDSRLWPGAGTFLRGALEKAGVDPTSSADI